MISLSTVFRSTRRLALLGVGAVVWVASSQALSADGSLTNGGNYSGAISFPHELDVWTFTANEGDSITLSAAEILTGGLDPDFRPRIRVIRPDSTEVWSQTGLRVAQIAVTAPETGTYMVLVADDSFNRDGSATAPYSLRLVRSPGALTIPAGDEGGLLANGINQTGVIEIGDLDPWTVQATQGDRLTIRVGEVVAGGPDPDFRPSLKLIGPTGAYYASNAGLMVAEMDVRAPVTGTYTVIVSDDNFSYDGSATGSYMLHLVRSPGAPSVFPGDQGGPAMADTPLIGTIHRGDLDAWTCTVPEAGTMNVTITETGWDSEFQPWIRLFGPTGSFLDSAFDDFMTGFTRPITNAGAYTIVVADSSFDNEGSATGTYQLTVSGVRCVMAPPSLKAVLTPLGVWLTWDAAAGATSYTVHRGTTPGGETMLVSGVAGTGYHDTSVNPGQRYYYVVTAVAEATTIAATNEASAALTRGTSKRTFFDGDGKTDIAIYRPTTGDWFIRPSSAGFNMAQHLHYQWGLPGDVPVPGDFDGDGVTDLAVYRLATGDWIIRYSSVGYYIELAGGFQWGLPGDLPIVGDFDGDRRADISIYRPTTGEWFIRNSSTGYEVGAGNWYYQWGLDGDQPIVGDFDGDGRTDLTVYRPTTGDWYIRYSAQGYNIATHEVFQWGLNDDVPLVGDFDGDGRADLTVYRPTTGDWYLRYSSKGYSVALHEVIQWGLPEDLPVIADLDGDGRTEITIYRPTTGDWYVRYSSKGYSVALHEVFQWGLGGDTPIR